MPKSFAKWILCTLTIALLVTCTKTDEANINYVTILPFEKDTTKISLKINNIIKFESEDVILVSPLRTIKLLHDKIYIEDSFRGFLNIFNTEGRLLKTVGKLGAGPGEFTKISDVDYNEFDSTFVVLANNDRKILRYDTDGNFMNEIPIQFFARDLSPLKDGFIVNVDFNTSSVSENANILLIDGKGSIKKRFHKYIEKNRPSSDFSGFLVSNKEGALYATSLGDTIYQITESHIYPKYFVDFGNLRVPEKVKEDISLINKLIDLAHLERPGFETDQLVILPFAHKQYLKKMIFNKITQKTIIDREMDDPLFELLSVPVGMDNNGQHQTNSDVFISEIFYEHWAYFEESKRLKILTKHPELSKYLTKLTEEDNPLLIFFEIEISN